MHGLDGADEWPVLWPMVPEVVGRRVVDLGCGFGWFSRWAAEQGAASVLGIDVSERMLDRAVRDTRSATVEYRRIDLDELDLAAGSADIVFSSLALHYVVDLDRLTAMVHRALSPGGSFVFSVEHPILSAPRTQEFVTTPDGDRVWPLDRYLVEGTRTRHWYVDGVEKQHRTIATYMNSLIDAGLVVERVVEWGPSADEVAARSELEDDLHRPWFLLVGASRPPD